MSAGCVRNCPRDIDLSRDMRWGKLSGLKVIWQILRNIKLFVGNDIVQMNDFHTIPLKLGWNELFFKFIKRFNKKVVRGCWGRLPLQNSNNFEPFFSDSTLTFLTFENTFRLPILPTRRAVLLCLPLI